MTEHLKVINAFDALFGRECVVKLRKGGTFTLSHVYEAEDDEYGPAFFGFIIAADDLEPRMQKILTPNSAMEFSECDIVWIKNKETGEVIYERGN